jgi:hypothetical protein
LRKLIANFTSARRGSARLSSVADVDDGAIPHAAAMQTCRRFGGMALALPDSAISKVARMVVVEIRMPRSPQSDQSVASQSGGERERRT